jgi:tetratricopeptide (TPR) repeat protein
VALLLLLATLAGGCDTVPLAPAAPPAPATAASEPVPPAAPAGVAAFERRVRERAQAQQREGRLAEAAVSWEILVALRPDQADYRERWTALRRQIDAAVPEHMQGAQQAWRRGELDAASTQFLAVLALKPDHVQAADALRAIERDRNRALYLGKLSRITLARSANGAALRAAKPGGPVDRNDLEHAALLRTQGEIDAAIALLERYVAVRGADATACRMLGDMAMQRPEAAGRAQPAGNTSPPPRAFPPCP